MQGVCARHGISYMRVRERSVQSCEDLTDHRTCVHQIRRTALTSREDGPFASRRTTGPGLDSMRATSTVDRDRRMPITREESNSSHLVCAPSHLPRDYTGAFSDSPPVSPRHTVLQGTVCGEY